MSSPETCECASCGKNRPCHPCGICGGLFCKKCSEVLADDAFSFLPEVAPNLKHTFYCECCFQEVVAPEQETYQATMDLAKDVFIFFKTQRKEIPLIKKSRELLVVEACDDRDETILRLAFFAAQKGFNAVIETEALAQKVRDQAYQTSVWRGSGFGAMVDGDKIARQDLQNQIYR